MELLYTFIECSIAILAFASIVAQFKKSGSDQWNVHQYQGIITHSVQAFVYSTLPLLLIDFPIPQEIVWTLSTLILGGITFLQAVVVMLTDKVSKRSVKFLMFTFSLLILLLQLTYVTGFIHSALAVYQVGIFWHLFQSITLIGSFIMHVEAENQEIN